MRKTNRKSVDRVAVVVADLRPISKTMMRPRSMPKRTLTIRTTTRKKKLVVAADPAAVVVAVAEDVVRTAETKTMRTSSSKKTKRN